MLQQRTTTTMKPRRSTLARSLIVVLVVTSAAISTNTAFAQRGDRTGVEMKEVWKELDVPEAPVLSPSEALESFAVAPGFRVELVAAEPLVEDPITLDWDEQGRLWVVEMRGFMPNVDGEGEQEPVGRVVVLEDTDQDGVMDEGTVFMDELVLPRALALVDGGALVAEPPNLWFARDTNGDLVADEKVKVAEYGDPHPDALEHTENGLLWALDNWLYNAKSDRRLRWSGGKITEEPTHFRGQWGISQDNYGRLYYNTNSRTLYGDLIPSQYVERNPNLRYQGQPEGLNLTVVPNELVYTIRVNPGINRGYQETMLLDDGRLERTTSVAGVAIYRGHQFPAEYVGDAFVPEPAGNIVTHHRVREVGASLLAEHMLYDDDRWGKREFLASSDERFRPVDAAIGPDGALYVVDMYRGILQHVRFVTTFLRKQILERGLDKPLGLGRIYRIVALDQPIDHSPPRLGSTNELVTALSDPNGWTRDTAQRLLVERAPQDAIPELRALAARRAGQSDRAELDELASIHALWTLAGIGRGALDDTTLQAALNDGGDRRRASALWALSELEPSRRDRFATSVAKATADPNTLVQLQALHTLGDLSRQSKIGDSTVEALQQQLLDRFADEPLRRQAIATGLRDHEANALATLHQTRSKRELHDLESWLAAAALRSQDEDNQQRLFALASDMRKKKRLQLLEQLAEVTGESDFGTRRLSQTPALLSASLPPKHRALVAQINEHVVVGPRDGRETGTASGNPSETSPDAAIIAQGQRLYSACQSCHGRSGQGQPGMGPRLVEATFIQGDPDNLVRIILNGLEGPLESNGESWNDIMPGFLQDRRFTDDAVAALATFLRQSWGHSATPVSPEAVQRLRPELGGRQVGWTVEQLEELGSGAHANADH